MTPGQNSAIGYAIDAEKQARYAFAKVLREAANHLFELSEADVMAPNATAQVEYKRVQELLKALHTWRCTCMALQNALEAN